MERQALYNVKQAEFSDDALCRVLWSFVSGLKLIQASGDTALAFKLFCLVLLPFSLLLFSLTSLHSSSAKYFSLLSLIMR